MEEEERPIRAAGLHLFATEVAEDGVEGPAGSPYARVPASTPESSLVKHFTAAVPRPGTTFSHTLYVMHRHSLLAPAHMKVERFLRDSHGASLRLLDAMSKVYAHIRSHTHSRALTLTLTLMHSHTYALTHTYTQPPSIGGRRLDR